MVVEKGRAHVGTVKDGARRPAGGVGSADLASPPGGVDDRQLAVRVRVAVARLHRRLRRESLAGLSPSQASALGSVARLGQPTLGELAAAELVRPPTITRVVDGLEEAGLLGREHDASDRRVWRVRLTAEGWRTLERVRTLKDAYLVRQLAGLDPAEHEAMARAVALLERMAGDA